MGDRFNILSQMEHLQSKYMGTGHADSTKFEWAAHQHRDTYSSLMGHQVILVIVTSDKWNQANNITNVFLGSDQLPLNSRK